MFPRIHTTCSSISRIVGYVEVICSFNVIIFNFRDLLHTTKRREEACKHLGVVLGEYCISCELQLAGPESVSQLDFSTLSEAVAEELFSRNLSRKEASLQTLSPDMEKVNLGAITVDDFLSPAHTLLQIQCVDQKSVVYDIFRTSKDFNIQVCDHEIFL